MSQEMLHFQAEVKQLLHLMIHSLYSNKEIFLRELISNASDAADKLRFEAITNPTLFEEAPDLQIEVSLDIQARTISVEDNGIGLSREEAISHLGTIAKSGTKEFFQNLSGDQKRDSALIGQFGVGFYSAFIVADEVTVESRRAGFPKSQGIRWKSRGEGHFSIENCERSKRGTCIILHLRDGEDDFLSRWRVKSIIQKYSDHVSLPIVIRVIGEKKTVEKHEDANTPNSEDANTPNSEFEVVNQANALWSRSKNEINDKQYISFYKHISHDSSEPLVWTHSRVEGRNEYILLLYIPSHAPLDLWDRSRSTSGLKLYVRRVFVMDDAEVLLPPYLRFIRGIVDSNELPLNVSREMLQESRDVRAIREGITKRVLTMIEDLSNNCVEKFNVFWNEFGQTFKEGIGEDYLNRERIAKLLRFSSTYNSGKEQTVSLLDYVSRMLDTQTKIYYANADTYLAAANSPHLEVFRKKGIEVLLLWDRIDEWMLSHLTEFEGKPIVSVARGNLDLIPDNIEKETQEKMKNFFHPLIEAMKKVLVDKVKDVRLSFRLTESPSCLVVDEGELSGHLQRMLKAAGQKAPDTKPVLEINPEHPLIKRLQPIQDDFDDWCYLFFDQALLAEGGILEDPAVFVKRTNSFLLKTNM